MTDRLSTGDPGGQRPKVENRRMMADAVPDVLPFDLHAEVEPNGSAATDSPDVLPLPGGPRGDDDEFDYDGDTAIDDDHDDEYDDSPNFPDGFDDDRDPSPPAAPAAVALTIRAPRGPQPVTAGFTVTAVVLEKDDDGEDNPINFAFLTPKKLQTRHMAVGLANFKAMRPERLPVKGATHIVVNDETGREVYRRVLLNVA